MIVRTWSVCSSARVTYLCGHDRYGPVERGDSSVYASDDLHNAGNVGHPHDCYMTGSW